MGFGLCNAIHGDSSAQQHYTLQALCLCESSRPIPALISVSHPLPFNLGPSQALPSAEKQTLGCQQSPEAPGCTNPSLKGLEMSASTLCRVSSDLLHPHVS